MKERRSATRIEVNSECTVFLDINATVYETLGIVRDISNNGICVEIKNVDDNYIYARDADEIRLSFAMPTEIKNGEPFVFEFEKRWIRNDELYVKMGGTYTLI